MRGLRRARASKRPKPASPTSSAKSAPSFRRAKSRCSSTTSASRTVGPAIAQGDIPTISAADGEILISLNKEKHGSTREYEILLRKRLSEKFPDMDFFFQPANITSQILNFGLPAPIDLQMVGRNAEANYKIAQRLARRIARIPGAADVHVHQVVEQPEIRLERGSHEGRADGTDAARRHQQHADFAQRQRHRSRRISG